MGKRKQTNDSTKESIEEKVLKRYHKSKQLNKSVEESEEVLEKDDFVDKTLDLLETDPKISEDDNTNAEKILKKVKKIKDKTTKKAIKLRKESRKLAKIKAKEQLKTSEDINCETNSNKSQLAINYLNDWKHRRNDWKFKKSLQIWLLKNWKNTNKVCDKDFDLFIEYIFAESKESLAKKRLESEAKQLIDSQSGDEEVDDKEEEVEETDKTKDQESIVERARRILQCIV